MRKLNNKGFGHVLLLAVLVIGIASIAYASFTQVLSISGTGTASGDFDVKITSITQTSATGVTNTTAPTFTGTSATFNADLAYPGATATYAVTVTNNGSIPAKLTAITDLTTINSAAPAYITFATSGVTAGTTTLPVTAGSNTNVVNVTVTWDGASNPDTSTGNTKSATITLNYDQDS